jgi:CRISPR-associated protein Cas1
MRLIINEYGTTIKRKENRFVVENKETNRKEEFSSDSVNQIVIASGSSISSGVIKLAMKNNIDIVYVNKFGTPYARIYPCKLGGTTLTRKLQAESYKSEKSLLLARAFIQGKILNQANLLKSLSKSRHSSELRETAKEILKFSSQILEVSGKNIDDIRERLLGLEGISASLYFQALTKILPFKQRDKESNDQVNIVLNYGYGILYSEIEKACIIAGLDPYLGYYHTDRYGKPSMVLDLIEEFRQPVVDRAVITLFVRKLINEKDFTKNGDSVFLSDIGRQKVIDAVMRRLYTRIKFGKKTMTLQGIILEQARNVVRFLMNEIKEYKPFVNRW